MRNAANILVLIISCSTKLAELRMHDVRMIKIFCEIEEQTSAKFRGKVEVRFFIYIYM